MKNFALWLILLIVGMSPVFAQEPEADPNAWKTHVEAGLGLTQSAYSDNWTGGEVGSVIWAANLHATAEKQLSPRFRTENDLKLAFGQTHSQSQETKEWASPVKSSDKIRFDSILKLTLNTWVDPYVAGVFQSQFYDASVPSVKRYVNPIGLTESAGASRTIFDKPAGKLMTRLGFGMREFIDKTVVDTLAQTTKTETSYDSGIEWVTDWTTSLSKTLTYTTKLTVFQAIFYSESDELEGSPEADYWKATDMTWENITTASVSKIVQVSLAWELWYDKQVSKGGRFKETLALGVAWFL